MCLQWPTALALLGGLIVTKATIIGGLSRAFGLSNGDSARTGLLLSGGGAYPLIIAHHRSHHRSHYVHFTHTHTEMYICIYT